MSKLNITFVFTVGDMAKHSRDEDFINYKRQARKQIVTPKKYKKEKYKTDYLKEV